MIAGWPLLCWLYLRYSHIRISFVTQHLPFSQDSNQPRRPTCYDISLCWLKMQSLTLLPTRVITYHAILHKTLILSNSVMSVFLVSCENITYSLTTLCYRICCSVQFGHTETFLSAFLLCFSEKLFTKGPSDPTQRKRVLREKTHLPLGNYHVCHSNNTRYAI